MTTDKLARRLEHCDAEQLSAVFDGATADQQSEIIRHRLRGLQRRLAPEDYAALTHLFRDNLRRVAADDQATAPQRRSTQSPPAVDAASRGRMETLARRVMFSTVLGLESRLTDIVARRRAYVAQQTDLRYDALLSGIILGDDDEASRATDDDRGSCYHSARLDQLLRDLADIEGGGDGSAWGDRDREAVVTLAGELSVGWLAGSTTLYVAGEPTVVPNVAHLRYQKLLLYGAASSPGVTQLSASDVDEQLDGSITDRELPTPAAGWSLADEVLSETAGHVYRLVHGLERCCGLDAPSCVLSGLLVYDRLCRLMCRRGAGATSSAAAQQPVGRQKTVDDRVVDPPPSQQPSDAQKLIHVSGQSAATDTCTYLYVLYYAMQNLGC